MTTSKVYPGGETEGRVQQAPQGLVCVPTMVRCRVWALGCRVLGLGSRFQSLGFWAWSSESILGLQGLGFKATGASHITQPLHLELLRPPPKA